MARDRFAALARMNFSSPYVALPQPADGGGEPAGLLPPVRRAARRGSGSRELADELDLQRAAGPAGRAALGRAEDAGRAGQVADQPARAAAARRADRQPRSRHRRSRAQLAGALPGGERLHDPARLAQHGRGRAAVRPGADDEARPHRRSRQPGELLARYGGTIWRRCSSTSRGSASGGWRHERGSRSRHRPSRGGGLRRSGGAADLGADVPAPGAVPAVLAAAAGARLLADAADVHLGFHRELPRARGWATPARGRRRRCSAACCCGRSRCAARWASRSAFLEEMWSRNLGHVFVSPLRPWELVAALIGMSMRPHGARACCRRSCWPGRCTPSTCSRSARCWCCSSPT